jgi:pimeloyl-ACP methyl ester carboxylesterase
VPIQTRLNNLLNRADATVRRLRPRAPEVLTPESAGAVVPRSGRFDRDRALSHYRRAVEIEGRLYNYVLYPGPPGELAVHFSAFFGEWGERRAYRAQFAGYFHRLRMFWDDTSRPYLFLCDTFGADGNGTYYKGEAGDMFVERAMDRILSDVVEELAVPRERVVAMGSSMGATAALRFSLRHGYGGAVAVTPHIDLDLCARHQGRERHVAAMLGATDVEDARHYAVTREIRDLVDAAPALPRLAIQSMEDDRGVHAEQVLPLVEQWRSRGGAVQTDFHPAGGHTSDYATADWFGEQLRWCLA